MVVEVKVGAVLGDQLRSELGRLSYKITHLRARLADLKRALDCEDTIHARFRSVHLAGRFERFRKSIFINRLVGP